MLYRVRDFWKDWWPFLSGAVVAAYTLYAYLSNRRDELFLIARIFRWELLFVFAVLVYVAGVRLITKPENPWRPYNAMRAAFSSARDAVRPGTGFGTRAAGALYAVATAAFAVFIAIYAYHTFVFLQTRYDDVDRQALLGRATAAEMAQDLPQALTLYKEVVQRFPLDNRNEYTNEQIRLVQQREDAWKQAVAAVNASAGPGLASTKFDQLFETCRWINNTAPCTQIDTYLKPAERAIAQAKRPYASCTSVVRATPSSEAWLFLDPLDQNWLDLRGADATRICAKLGLRTGKDLADYLDQRWYVSEIGSWREGV